MRKSLSELMNELDGLPDSYEKLNVLEMAIELADEEKQIDNAYYLRQEYVYLAHVFGYAQKALVAFLWCLEQYDKQPERFDEHELLWQYKWMMGALGGFPQLSREKLMTLASDMQRRFERSGWSLGPVQDAMSALMYFLGDWDASLDYKEKSMVAEVDGLSDCPACRQQLRVQFNYDKEDYERVVKESKMILQGSLRCRTVPRRTYQVLMDVEFKRGNLEEAMSYLKRLQACIPYDAQHYIAWLDSVTLLSFLDNMQAVSLYTKHFAMVLDQEQPFDQMQAFTVGAMVLRQWEKNNPDEKHLILGFPAKFPRFTKGGLYDVVSLRLWFETQAKSIASQFDKRNANSFFSGRVQRKLTLADTWVSG